MTWYSLFFGDAIEGVAIEGNGFVSPESKIYRFLMNGRLDLPAGDLVDLSTIPKETLSTLEFLLTKINIGDLLGFLHVLYRRRQIELSPLQKTIPYLLAIIARIPEQRGTVMHYAPEFLTKPEQLVLFVRYYMDPVSLPTDDSFMKFVQMWYKKQNYRAIAKMITEDADYDGWSHRKILRLGCVTSKNTCCKAVLEYACNGMRSLIINYFDVPKAATVIEYFMAMEKLKNTTNSKTALEKITYCPDSIITVNSTVLEDKNVIKALIKRMDVRQLLNMVDFMSTRNFFRNGDDSGWDLLFVHHVSYRLNNTKEIKNIRLHPSESFIAHQSYLYKRKTLNEFAEDNGSPITPEPLISTDIASAIQSQMDIAFKNLTTINIDITVIIDPYIIAEQFCGKEEYIPVDKAAALIAIVLKKTGRQVNIFTFDQSEPVRLNEDSFVALSTAINSKSSKEPSTAITDFVSETSTELVVVVGHSLQLSELFEIANKNTKARKFVFCNLSEGNICSLKDHDDVLLTAGFNEFTCDIITLFAIFSFCQRKDNPSKIAFIRRLGQK